MNQTQTNSGTPLRAYIDHQAKGLGFSISGKLSRCEEFETATLDKCFIDEMGNVFMLRHGILTIVAADGRVY